MNPRLAGFTTAAPHERSVPLLIFTLALQLAAIAFNAGVL